MKKIIFLVACFIYLKISAQVPYFDYKKFKEDKYSNRIFPLDKKMSSKDSLFKFLEKTKELSRYEPMGRLVFTQTNGTKVYALPKDNMPCIVPDMSQFNMPIAGRSIKITGMPPGSIPPNKIIPDKNK